jgi:hypothetical protein
VTNESHNYFINIHYFFVWVIGVNRRHSLHYFRRNYEHGITETHRKHMGTESATVQILDALFPVHALGLLRLLMLNAVA